MREIGSMGMHFGEPSEIREAHPGHFMWGDDPKGQIGDAVVLFDGTECIAIFIGCGRGVLISGDGVYVDDDCADEARLHQSRVNGGAWISKALYDEAKDPRAVVHKTLTENARAIKEYGSWYGGYIQEIQRQLIVVHGFSENPEKPGVPMNIPDGTYPMTINEKLDQVLIQKGKVWCCNFESYEW